MATVEIDRFTVEGEKADSVKLSAQVFGVEPNLNLIAQAIHVQRQNARAYTAHTKGRSDVRGGGRKPWRQKGTGRARQGSIRSPQWAGGGVVFGPKALVRAKRKLPRGMKKALYCSLFSWKRQLGSLKVLKDYQISGKTSDTKKMLAAVGVQGKVLLIGKTENEAMKRSVANLAECLFIPAENLNALELTQADTVFLSQEVAEEIANRYAN